MSGMTYSRRRANVNYQRWRYLAAGLVILCLSGGASVPRPSAAAELRDQKSIADKKDDAVETPKESGVSDQETNAAKIEFGPNPPGPPRRAGNWKEEKPELHGHYPCEELHQSAAIEACKKRREQSR
jgi:hypothetical protein